MRRGSPSGDSSTAPAMRILPRDLARLWPGLLRCGTGGSSGPQAGCDPDRPWHGAACAAGARHSCNCRARAGPGVAGRIPFEWLHDVNGHEPGLQGQGLRCMIVPAVTEVSFPQAAHSQLARRRFSSQPLSAAGGADEAVGPAPGGEMPGTGGFIGKARLEGGAGHRAVIFPANGMALHEHPAERFVKPGSYLLIHESPSPIPCSCSCLRTRSQRRELHGADSDMAQRLETAMAHTLRLGIAEWISRKGYQGIAGLTATN